MTEEKKDRPLIVGMGLAGLLAANMLRRRDPMVIEAQAAPPNNHSAVLRFRSPVVGDVLGIPFKKVRMMKGSEPQYGAIGDALAYSLKCTGTARSDRSIGNGEVTTHDRYIAPPDLVARMLEGVQELANRTDYPLTKYIVNTHGGPILSTMPMGALMELLEYPRRGEVEFKFVHGINLIARLSNVDAYVSVYVPDLDQPLNRVSITGDLLIGETSAPIASVKELQDLMPELDPRIAFEDALEILGLRVQDVTPFEEPVFKLQRYSKILPIDEGARKEFMHWATDKFNVYSLGRYATWRPGLMLDDLVQDIRLIDRWIGSRYDINLHR